MATEKVEDRRHKLAEAIEEEGADLPWQERSKLHSLLLKHHQAFCLEEGERGETDLVELKIDTGDAAPIKQQVHRISFAVGQEVARQLREMQEAKVISPSNSPWGVQLF